ncbi:UDP-3-O-(3-hydroxymyristoyl)glucosamine N-acyltransferase [Castellaniella sp.]|uniref:UDP-3-O-(3-hydroxymyristoyl)glucosamine N-acyltransferase n=1 Tax=Castellaniella sp. TaxID=1955812 RepID=UPI002AFF1743|nr:UDP-3-O-(3-hydroxymyristoyl)glucosamine N-acyltransferase [Castellaniella sp.]
MKSRWIVGAGDCLDVIFHACKQAYPGDQVEKIIVPQTDDDEFDSAALDALAPDSGTAFVAFDESFGNMKRMELMRALMVRGFRLDTLISPSAVVAEDAIIGMNVFIGPNATIGHGCRVDFNTIIHAGVIIGPNSRVKSSCWLESGVQLDSGVEIGAYCILRMGAAIRSQVTIGRGCELGWPRMYEQDVLSNTFFDPRYDEPIYVYAG